MLLGTAPDKKGFLKLLADFYFSFPENFSLKEEGIIHNIRMNKDMPGVKWELKNKRYRLVSNK